MSDSLKRVLKERNETLISKKAQNTLLNKEIESNNEKISKFESQIKVCKTALEFLEEIANLRRNSIKSKIESILTEAIKMIYGENYKVELTYSFKNNRSNMEIEAVKTTQFGEVRRTMEGFGGGVSDCIAVPLRLLVLLGSRQTDKVCILDEAFKHVDIDRVDNVAQFIKNISSKLGIQIILLSHHEVMTGVANKVYQIQDNDGKSLIKETN